MALLAAELEEEGLETPLEVEGGWEDLGGIVVGGGGRRWRMGD